MVQLSMTLSDLWPRFQGHDIFRHWISQKWGSEASAFPKFWDSPFLRLHVIDTVQTNYAFCDATRFFYRVHHTPALNGGFKGVKFWRHKWWRATVANCFIDDEANEKFSSENNFYHPVSLSCLKIHIIWLISSQLFQTYKNKSGR